MEDASSARPLPVKASSLEESVALLEQEVVVDELLLLSVSHALQTIVFTLKIAVELIKSSRDVIFDLFSLFLGHS